LGVNSLRGRGGGKESLSSKKGSLETKGENTKKGEESNAKRTEKEALSNRVLTIVS